MTRRHLPDHLDTLKQEAKSLLKAVKAGDNEALDRVAPYFDDSANVSLQNMQLVIAREHQFESWSKLKAYVSMASIEKAGREHNTGPRGSSIHVFAVPPNTCASSSMSKRRSSNAVRSAS